MSKVAFLKTGPQKTHEEILEIVKGWLEDRTKQKTQTG